MNVYIYWRSSKILKKPKFIKRYVLLSNLIFIVGVLCIIIFVGLPHLDHNSFRFYFLINLLFVTNFIFTSLFFLSFFISNIIQLVFKLLGNNKKPTKFILYNFRFFTGIFISCVSLIIYGSVWGKSSFVVNEVSIYSERIPKSFDGLRILHFSDTHLGSFWNTKTVEKGINLINQQNADIIFLTGDIVNISADEITPYTDILKTLNAKHGKFAVLGNHDMSDYHKMDIQRDSLNVNTEKIVETMNNIGFNVLRNSRTYIFNNPQDSIRIAGTDNWGKPPFQPWGDLNKTMLNADTNTFTILLSHDPSLWTNKIKGKKNIDLTLSGHTHGLQVGIKTDNFKFSPISLKYKYWGGLYEYENQKLYINTGFGFIGFPARIGIPPEITVLTLKKNN